MKPFIRSILTQLPILLTLAACASTGEGQTPPPAQNEPGVVQGIALDTQGRPIAGALVWIRPSVTTGLITARTDENGRYRVKGPSNLPYHAFAWHTVEYRGKNLCFRLASEKLSDYDSFVPTSGVVRNFKWQMNGSIPDYDGNFFGAEFRVFLPGYEGGGKTELTLVPDGPLVDGSAGKTLKYTIGQGDSPIIGNVPVGVYKVTAVHIAPDGKRNPLNISPDGYNDLKPQFTLQWENKDSCKGSSASGPERAFFWLRLPE